MKCPLASSTRLRLYASFKKYPLFFLGRLSGLPAGRPNFFIPASLTRFNPAFVRSEINSRSNAENADKIANCNLPVAELKSMLSFILIKLIPLEVISDNSVNSSILLRAQRLSEIITHVSYSFARSFLSNSTLIGRVFLVLWLH